MKLFLAYMYESIKGHEKENESNALLNNLLEEYFDIFSMNLSRILPTREVDHTIDLDPNAKPFVKLHIIIPIWKTKNWNE
jgi:hypothetical protein